MCGEPTERYSLTPRKTRLTTASPAVHDRAHHKTHFDFRQSSPVHQVMNAIEDFMKWGGEGAEERKASFLTAAHVDAAQPPLYGMGHLESE